jgi:hypothetical protein
MTKQSEPISAERILAAIEKAEGLLGAAPGVGTRAKVPDLGPEAVVLAKALWEQLDSFGAWARADEPKVREWISNTQEALRTFVEKVEACND